MTIRENEELFRRLAESWPGMVYRMSLPDGRYEYVGEAAVDVFGYTSQEFLDQPLLIRQVIHPDWHPYFAEQWEALLAGDMPKFYEYQIIHGRSGETRWMRQRNALVRDADGTPIAIEGIVTDVTERKNAELALLSEKEFTETVLDAQQDTFFLFDPATGKAIRWNRAFRETTGYTDEEIADLPAPTSYYSRDDLERAETFLEALFETGSGTIELDLICKDGRKIPTEYNASVVGDGDGDPRYFISIGRDVSERKRVEKVARTHRERLLRFMDSATDSFHIVDSNLVVVDINERALQSLRGVVPWIDSRDDVVGKSLLEIYPFMRGDGGEIRYREVLRTRERIQFDDAVENPTVGTVHMTVRAFMVGDDLGIIATDISDRKRAEEDRLHLERQVQHAQKLESLGVLAGGIAHDFNNLLVTILGHADLALEELPPGAPARDHIDGVLVGARRAAELAGQMLAYSGKGRFEFRKIDLGTVVREMAHLLQASVLSKAPVEYDFAAALPFIDGDTSQIRQVIMNLMTNAADAVAGGGGISVATGALHCDAAYLRRTGLGDDLPEGNYVYLDVADTGCGMDDKTRERLFEPFFTTKFTGRGLGMAAVQGIIKGHRGTIEVASEIDRGTRFRVLFPASDQEAELSGVLSGREGEEAVWHAEGTVLLVDDDESVRALGKLMLQKVGFDVLAVADGPEALETIKKHRKEIVCVLLDLTMPHMDGVEVLHELRRVKRDVPVIMSSGFNEQEITGRLDGEVLDGFIKKPYGLATMRLELRRVLGQERDGSTRTP